MTDPRAGEALQKLLRALELGTKKAEPDIDSLLRDSFSIPKNANIVSQLKKEPLEKVFVVVFTAMAPFSCMLQEIYEFLAEQRATMGAPAGRRGAEEIALNFADINEYLNFPLDNFPKTFVDAIVQQSVTNLMLDTNISGDRLLIDNPIDNSSCWRTVNALDNACAHPLILSLSYIIRKASGDASVRAQLKPHRAALEQVIARCVELRSACAAVAGEIEFDPYPNLRLDTRSRYAALDGEWLTTMRADLAKGTKPQRHDSAGRRRAVDLDHLDKLIETYNKYGPQSSSIDPSYSGCRS